MELDGSTRADPSSEAALSGPRLATERAFVEAVVGGGLVRRIHREIVGRLPADDESVPVPHGDYVYTTRQRAGRPHWIHCRRRVADGREEVVLDVNRLAAGGAYCAVPVIAISPDHRRVAYGVDRRGDERLELWCRDLSRPGAADRLLSDRAGPTVAWSADARSLFYTVCDEACRPARLLRHDLDRGSGRDALLYEEPDEAFRLSVSRTESGEYVVLAARSLTATEIHYLPSARPDRGLSLLRPRRPGVRYALTHHGDRFYLLTNEDGAFNFRLASAPVTSVSRAEWQELIPHREDVSLERLEAFSDHLVVWERCHGLRRIRVMELPPGTLSEVRLPDQPAALSPEDNRQYRTTRFRFGYSSLITPYTVLEYDLEERSLRVAKQSAVRGVFHPSDYESKRLMAPAEDGVEVPITLVYRRGRRRSSGNPTLLYGYGAYGYRLEPEFDPARLSLLDRGVLFAIAHVRGGGELGEAWHDRGKGMAKKTSMRDFIACAEYLVAEGYAARGEMAAMGESAGGLLVAAVANERPDLFRAVVADCPFVDVLGALSDRSLPLTVGDWEEWGDPSSSAEAAAYIASYSPCNNVRPSAHPAVLAVAGEHDPWVPVAQPARWVERLRRTNAGDRPILFWVEPAGHRGPSDRFAFLHTTALKIAFVLGQLGVEDPRS